jgi:hypothetical protein
MEGKAKVVWSQFLRGPDAGFMFVAIGTQSDQDREDAIAMMEHWCQRELRRREQQAAASQPETETTMPPPPAAEKE